MKAYKRAQPSNLWVSPSMTEDEMVNAVKTKPSFNGLVVCTDRHDQALKLKNWKSRHGLTQRDTTLVSTNGSTIHFGTLTDLGAIQKHQYHSCTGTAPESIRAAFIPYKQPTA